ncbi:membrane-bound lytic murein transglycosylase B [Oxalobacteraceae bacterium GrIS 2.11]
MSPAQTTTRKFFSKLSTLAFVLALIPICLPTAVFAEEPAHLQNTYGEPIDFKTSTEVHAFIDFMVTRHGFSTEELEQIFGYVQFCSKCVQLIKPAPVTKLKNWAAYRARFIEPTRINAGVKFWTQYADALNRAEKQFGVPAQIIVGIIGVETLYGKTVGKFRVLDALSTLSFAYPDTVTRESRMAYFLGELEQTLLFARESGIEPFSLVGSYAGAIGWSQFMPSSIRQYAVDYDGDGKVDLRNSPIDAIGSVANFLAQHGWESGLPLAFPATIVSDPEKMLAKELNATYTLQELENVAVPSHKNTPTELQYGLIDLQNGDDPTQYWLATRNFFAITKYNRSYFYAMSVVELGKAVCHAKFTNISCE